MSNKAHCVSGAGLLTNLIQIFRWPDKGYSPPVLPLITTAIPLACLDTRSAPHETSPSSSCDTALLGKRPQSFTEGPGRPHFAISHPPLSSSSLSGTDLEPIHQETIFKRQALVTEMPHTHGCNIRTGYQNGHVAVQPFLSSGHDRY